MGGGRSVGVGALMVVPPCDCGGSKRTLRKVLLKDRAFLIAQLIKNPPALQETVQFLGWEDLLEKG